MEDNTKVIEYKCPCCDAALKFSGKSGKMQCEYCDNEFEMEAVLAYNDAMKGSEEFHWDDWQSASWEESETDALHVFVCPSCAGEIMTDENTAATFCPYCGNPTIFPQRLSDRLKPDGVIPFRTTREDARKAFLRLCKKKPLLPKLFSEEQQIEKITGMYIPYWLYDCESEFHGSYKATRIHHWSDAHYDYTKTDYFMLERASEADFCKIPMDASQKMDDTIMESIEPYDYSQLIDFEKAYLSGYLADKYDVSAKDGEERIRQRVSGSMEQMVSESMIGYSAVIPIHKRLNIAHGKAKYVLLPVWMLSTRYKGKIHLFAMNAQTGKMTGSFPICPKRTAAWFSGIFAGVAAIAMLVQILLW